eukprot:m.5760 g.5760  ORF g.5760 m.5760 type:complete len:491 (-) comp2543_c0_seq1:172-1644(-)
MAQPAGLTSAGLAAFCCVVLILGAWLYLPSEMQDRGPRRIIFHSAFSAENIEEAGTVADSPRRAASLGAGAASKSHFSEEEQSHSDGHNDKATWPFEDKAFNEICKAQLWFSKYTAFHRNGLEALHRGEKLPVVAFRCHDTASLSFNETQEDIWCGGLGDRLPGIVSSFVLAVLSNRIFLMDWTLAPSAFEHNFINWEYESALANQPERSIFTRDVHHNPIAFLRILGNMESEGERPLDFDTISLIINRARATLLFDVNELPPKIDQVEMHHHQLTALGFQRENIFGCILRYLLQVPPRVKDEFRSYASILSDPDTLAIGIHIRTTDKAMFRNESLPLERYRNRFESAQEIERLHGSKYKRVVWLLLSDNDSLRQASVVEYGSKVMITHITPYHVNKFEHDMKRSNKHTAIVPPLRALETSIGEWWLYSLCDYFILDPWSGFSRTALFYSLKQGNIVVQTPEAHSRHETAPDFEFELITPLDVRAAGSGS